MSARAVIRGACAALAAILVACGAATHEVRVSSESARGAEEFHSPALSGPILALHALNGATLFAASDGGGIARSDDSGRTWRPFAEGASGAFVTGFAHSTREDVFAATLGAGILKLERGANVWRRVDAVAVPAGALDRVTDIVVSPFDNNVYATTLGHGVYRSTDLGASWREYSDGLHIMNINVIACTEANSLYARCVGGGIFYRSTTMDRWMPVNDGLEDPYVTTMEPQRNGTAVVGTRSGTVYRLNALGTHWDSVGTGTGGAYITHVCTTPEGQILAATKIGVFHWVPVRVAWEQVDKVFANREVRVLEAAPGGSVYAGMADGGVIRIRPGVE